MVTFDQIGIGVLADAGGQVAVAAAALVVVLTIVIVFVMVLRSNGAARTASGLGFDAQQGALGQPQNNPDAGPWSRPISQQGQGAAAWGPQADAAQAPWGGQQDFGGQRGGAPAAKGGWAGPDAGDAWGQPSQGGNASWGAPAQPAARGGWEAPQVPPSRPATPQWGETPAPGAQAPWGAPAQGAASNPGWGVPDQPTPAWGAPAPSQAQAPAAGAGGWGAPAQGGASNPGWGGAAGSPDWGAPAQPQAGGWGGPSQAGQMAGASPAAPAQGGPLGFDAAGFGEGDRTRVARQTGGPRTGVIVVRQGKEPGRIFEVRKDRLTIGRSRDSDIFLEDLAVSRLHTTVARDDQGRYIIRDENSANGTYVNSQRVSEQPLEEGDEIQVGQTVLAFMRR